MRRLAVIFMAIGLVVISALPALAAEPDEVADGIADDGVFVEVGSSTSDSEIGRFVGEARNDGESLSIVVLSAEPVAGATTFADAVIDRGVRGLVLVIAPDSLGYAGTGDIYTVDELEHALDVAIERGGDDGDIAGAFVEALTGADLGSDPSGSSGGRGGFVVFVVIVVVLIGGFVWWRSRARKQESAAAADRIAAARAEVQKRIDDVANDLLDMEDEVRAADNDRADRFYNEAGDTYRAVSDALDTAGTPQDLLQLSNKLDVAIWQLDTAEAILDGTELPERPEPRTLGPPQDRTAPIDTSRLPGSSYERRSTRRSSYASGSSMMDMLLQLGTAYAAGRASSRPRSSRGIGGLLGGGTTRTTRTTSSASRPRQGTGGRVRGGRRRRR